MKARGVVVTLMLLTFVILAYGVHRDQFDVLIVLFSLLFLGYYWLITYAKFSLRSIILIGFLFRLAFLASTPVLSDDYFRFVWDGRILTSGNNPYLILPAESLQEEIIVKQKLQGEVYSGLNSKNYYSIYPPINQFFFGVATFLGNRSLPLEVFWMRIILLLFEAGTFFLLIRLLRYYHQKPEKIILYAFNPLVVIELIGNLHFEGVMLFFGLSAVWLWTVHQKIGSSVALALAIGIKLLPLMMLPMVFRKMRFWQAIIYSAFTVGLVILFFLPFISPELISNFGSSVDLYFQKFEFNASIYYLVREVGQYFTGYNIIHKAGPFLSLVVFVIILLISWQKKYFTHSIFEKALIIMSIYLIFATTVHPWYITTLVGISVLTRFKYPLVWSYLVLLSYSHYWHGGFQEKYFIICLEYTLLLGFIVLEYLKFRNISDSEWMNASELLEQ